jgi:hypothetical protein
MEVPGLMHLLVERMRVLDVPIVKQRDSEATVQRCHFSTLSGGHKPRQQCSKNLQPGVGTERRRVSHQCARASTNPETICSFRLKTEKI